MDSGLVSREAVDGYVQQIDVGKDGRIGLDAFRQFIRLLDTVLVDGEGNLLE